MFLTLNSSPNPNEAHRRDHSTSSSAIDNTLDFHNRNSHLQQEMDGLKQQDTEVEKKYSTQGAHFADGILRPNRKISELEQKVQQLEDDFNYGTTATTATNAPTDGSGVLTPNTSEADRSDLQSTEHLHPSTDKFTNRINKREQVNPHVSDAVRSGMRAKKRRAILAPLVPRSTDGIAQDIYFEVVRGFLSVVEFLSELNDLIDSSNETTLETVAYVAWYTYQCVSVLPKWIKANYTKMKTVSEFATVVILHWITTFLGFFAQFIAITDSSDIVRGSYIVRSANDNLLLNSIVFASIATFMSFIFSCKVIDSIIYSKATLREQEDSALSIVERRAVCFVMFYVASRIFLMLMKWLKFFTR